MLSRRWTYVGLLAAAGLAAITACSGVGSSSTGASLPPDLGAAAGIGGAVSAVGAANNGGGPAPGEGGSAGLAQGGAPPTDSKALPDFLLIEASAEPDAEFEAGLAARPATLEPTDLLSAGLQITAVNADGSVLVGSAHLHWTRARTQQDWYFKRAFRWTVETGVHEGLFPGLDTSGPFSLSADGSVVFGTSQDDPNGPVKLYRWSEAGGLEDLAYPPYRMFRFSAASADGSTALAYASHDDVAPTLRWHEGSGWESLGTFPGPMQLSADGSVAQLGPTAVWSEQGGVFEVPSPCALAAFSSSGAALGSCYTNSSCLRLTSDQTITPISDANLPLGPQLLSADGLVAVLTGPAPANPVEFGHFYRWTEATGPEYMTDLANDAGRLRLIALSEHGDVLIGNYDDQAASWYPIRWSSETGRQALATPAGYDGSVAVSANRDGSLVAGFAFSGSYYLPPGAEGGTNPRRVGQVVVWDETGPRVLAEELSGLIANPDDVAKSAPLFVGQTKDAIVVVGNGVDHGWVARLATR